MSPAGTGRGRPPVVRITSRAHFSASHRLHNDVRDEAWNQSVFGKCDNPHGHGHTYELEVTVEGAVDRETGWVLDFADLKRIVADGWAFAYWCESVECEAKVKEDTKATTRNIPVNQPDQEGICVVCGKPSRRKVYFARAY